MPRRRKPVPVARAKTRLQELQSMRRVLAEKIDDESTPARDLSPLVRRLQEIGEAVETLEVREAEAADNDQRVSTADEPFRLEVI